MYGYPNICAIFVIYKSYVICLDTSILFTDIGFKIIFGQPASKELLIILLNELLAGEHHIEDLVFSG